MNVLRIRLEPTPSSNPCKQNNYIILTMLSIILSVLALTGCGNALGDEIEEGVPEQIVVIVEPDETIEPEPIYPFQFPLTGMGTDSPVEVRPVMVMVENSPGARPQTGLAQADLVFEILAEGEITRFVAVYQSESPEIIGPVRSIRPYYVEIGDGLDALIVHAGWSQEAMNMMSSRKLAHFDEVYGDGAYYWRDNSRKAPHNLYTSIEKIREGAEKKQFRQQWEGSALTFTTEDQLLVGQEAHNVTVNYIHGYNVTYEYNREEGIYKRFMEGEPHQDRESGVQLTGTNILICEASHRIVDNIGRRAVDVLGPGKGYLVQQGKVREITWEFQEGIIRPFVEGIEVPLIPGKTWIHVVPEGSETIFE